MFILIFVLTLVFISWSTTAWLVHRFTQKGLLDIPNNRSSHTTPTPTGGGAAILLTITFGFSILTLHALYHG